MPDAQPSVIEGVLKRPFAEQVTFFRAKLGNLVPTQRWDDIERSAHDRAFVVAGAQKADLLTDLAAAVDRAISEGKSLESFRQDFRAIVERNGWHGWTGEGTAAGEAWRTRVIYTTNAATSYAAGRVAQLKEGGFTHWVYRHNDSVLNPRPQHLAWDGLTLPANDPFWATHYPPNGWGCRCYVVGARSERGARRLGGNPEKPRPENWNAPDPKTGAPAGIDRGWDYQPGRRAQAVRGLAEALAPHDPVMADLAQSLAPKLGEWDQPLREAYLRGLPLPAREALVRSYLALPSVADDDRRAIERLLRES